MWWRSDVLIDATDRKLTGRTAQTSKPIHVTGGHFRFSWWQSRLVTATGGRWGWSLLSYRHWWCPVWRFQVHPLLWTSGPLKHDNVSKRAVRSWSGILRSRICDDISSNLTSSCSNRVSTCRQERYDHWHSGHKDKRSRTNAVNSWGLEISPGLRGTAGVGVLSLAGPLFGLAGVGAGVTLRGRADDGCIWRS